MRISAGALSKFLAQKGQNCARTNVIVRQQQRKHRQFMTTALSSAYQSIDLYQSTRFPRNAGPNVDSNNVLLHHVLPGRFFSSSTEDKSTNEAASTSISDDAEHYEFQAETRQLLDIVTHSLYTDKEVFLRELVSNASDACEKLRHIQVTGVDKEGNSTSSVVSPDLPLEIRIWTDEKANTLTIQDTGIGLTKEEMITNLGTIARSGSRAFVQAMQNQKEEGEVPDATKGIIGKFGVGFYSAFMVGDTVEVKSRPALESDSPSHNLPHVWTSTGLGTYDVSILHEEEEETPTVMDAEIIGETDEKDKGETTNDKIDDKLNVSPAKQQERGSSVVIHLKSTCNQFSKESEVKRILKKYSNFVNFPILLNGEKVNTVNATWSKDPKEVSSEEYTAFYKFIANAYDVPLDHIHFRADAPLEVKALFFIPSFHSEKHGMGRMDPGVSLYSRKVLIEHKSPDILPDWLRFVKGVVDSEDLPLSISRERSQDTALVKKLRRVLVRKILNHLASMAKKNAETYKTQFWKEYGYFLKEGICQDFEFQEPLSKLLYFETNKGKAGELSSLEEYVGRCTPSQKDIYYLCAPNRNLALSSPYLEGFKDREVLLVYSAIDDFVLTNLSQFQGRNMVNAETGGLDVSADKENKKDDEEKDVTTDATKSVAKLSVQDADKFCAWFQMTVGNDKISKVKVTSRLDSSPAVVTDHESGALKRMLKMVSTTDSQGLDSTPLPKQTVEINPKHPIIVRLYHMRDKEPEVARILADQLFDNCLIAAGLIDDSRTMLPRLNDLMLCVLNEAEAEHPKADENEVPKKHDKDSDPLSTITNDTNENK